MNAFQTVLSDVFDRGAERRLTQEDESAALVLAAAGDETATVALVYAYAPALRNAVGRYRDALEPDDARAEAVAGLLVAIAEYDPAKDNGGGLSGLVAAKVSKALGTAAAARIHAAIPERTLQRFYGILRRADGDLDVAASIAPHYELSREAFHAIAEALRAWDSLDSVTDGPDTFDGIAARTIEATPLWASRDDLLDAEDRILVETAFRAVDDLEGDVCRLAYGFADYEPVADAEIAHRLGYSRPKIQRVRSSALGKMREALAVDVDA